MSTYEDYSKKYRLYDDRKAAIGADVIASMGQLYCGKKLQDLHILDAGCGTGNYAKALIELGVRQMTLLDASSGMLEIAKDKLKDYIAQGVIKEIAEAKLPLVPFPDQTFDVVMFNLVLNHLDLGNLAFPNCVSTLKESVRTLRPDGIITVSTVLPATLSRVTWFSQLNMDYTERFNAAVLPSMEQFEKMFEDAGIKCIQKLNILGSDLYKNYFNLDGPLDEAWRKPSSYWSFATEEEVATAIQKVKSLKEKGEYEKWIKEHDHTSSSGVLTILICKPIHSNSVTPSTD